MSNAIPTTATAGSRFTAAVEVRELTVARDGRVVVGNVSLDVQEGEILALLGNAGSGTTELLACIAGQRAPDAGTVHVLGHDPYPEARAARGLLRNAHTRRPIVMTPAGRPRVVVLDEPTSGLAPAARRAAWSEVDDLRERGATVLVATRSWGEAERLADRIAFIDLGRLVALDTPQGLLRMAGLGQRLRFTANAPIDEDWIRGLPEVSGVTRHRNDEFVVAGDERMVYSVVALLAAHDVLLHRLVVAMPTLDDAFLTLAGRRLADSGGTEAGPSFQG